MDILEIFPISLAADRAETFVHHDLGKTDDGIERRADLMADFCKELGLCRGSLFSRASGVDQFLLAPLPGSNIAEHCTHFFAVLDTTHGDVQRDKATLAHSSDYFITRIQHAGTDVACEPIEMVEYGAPTFGYQQILHRKSDQIGRLVAKKRFGAPVGGEHAAGGIEHEHSIRGGVEDSSKLVVLATQCNDVRRCGINCGVGIDYKQQGILAIPRQT